MFDKLVDITKERLKTASHDLEHTFRVYNNCVKIAENEKNPQINMDVLRAAAILHDIARPKEDMHAGKDRIDHAIVGAADAKEILIALGASTSFSEHVASAIKTHRFRGGLVPETIEAQILFDADKLDVIGYIGIARSYMIAGEQGQNIYNDCNIDNYIKTNLVGGTVSGKIIDLKQHTPNIEFAIKNVRIPDKMFTQTGKQIAVARLNRMREFFEGLKEEIDGQR